jgi:hypothetical protein
MHRPLAEVDKRQLGTLPDRLEEQYNIRSHRKA